MMRRPPNGFLKRGHTVMVGAVLALGLVFGCAERSEEATEADLPEYIQEANSLIRAAEVAMENAGVFIDFDDPEKLSDLTAVLPDPDELATPDVREELETAIDALYGVFDVTNVTLDPPVLAAPMQGIEPLLSETDLALIHTYLAYLYSLDAVSRVAEVGGDLYTVEYPQNFDTGEVYNFRLLVDVAGMSPEEVLALFNDAQKQAILDAIRLLSGGIVRAESMLPAVDEALFQRSALFHINEAIDVIASVSPEIEQALDELNTAITEQLTAELLAELEDWGFVIEQLPPELEELLQ